MSQSNGEHIPGAIRQTSGEIDPARTKYNAGSADYRKGYNDGYSVAQTEVWQSIEASIFNTERETHSVVTYLKRRIFRAWIFGILIGAAVNTLGFWLYLRHSIHLWELLPLHP